jgi:hypothetical protein
MMNVILFNNHIIIPALKAIGACSKAAERLVLGTALVESRLESVRQIGGGPALGYFQMEPDTHDDIWVNFLTAQSRALVKSGLCLLTNRAGNSRELEVNPFYAAAMCRIHYLRKKQPLPDASDLTGMARYWKYHYNTLHGKGKEADFLEKAAVIINI